MQIALLLAVQITLGAAVVIFAHPLLLAVAHNGVAALLVLLLTISVYRAGAPRQAPLTMDR